MGDVQDPHMKRLVDEVLQFNRPTCHAESHFTAFVMLFKPKACPLAFGSSPKAHLPEQCRHTGSIHVCLPANQRPSPVAQGDHEKPDKQLQAANVQAQQPKGLRDAAQMPEKQRQVGQSLSMRDVCIQNRSNFMAIQLWPKRTNPQTLTYTAS